MPENKPKSTKGKIGLREIAAQPPGPFLIWDSEVRGFNVRRQFSDAITYSVIYRSHDGRQHWLKIGRHGVWTPTQAREKAKDVLRMVDVGKDPSAERQALRSGATIAELVDDYLADMSAPRMNGKKASTIKANKSRIANHIRPKLGKLRVAAITQDQIEAFANDCPSGSAKTIVQLLSAIFTFAIKRKLVAINPCTGIDLPKDNRKTRRLSIAEYQQLGRALSVVQECSTEIKCNLFGNTANNRGSVIYGKPGFQRHIPVSNYIRLEVIRGALAAIF